MIIPLRRRRTFYLSAVAFAIFCVTLRFTHWLQLPLLWIGRWAWWTILDIWWKTLPRNNSLLRLEYGESSRFEHILDRAVTPCGLTNESNTSSPSLSAVYNQASPFPRPLLGSYQLLDLDPSPCFDHNGRLGPYLTEPIDWSQVPLSYAQDQCFRKNRHLFQDERRGDGRSSRPRTAFILRAWEGFSWTENAYAFVRSLVNELSLTTGGQYRIFILVHIKSTQEPFWLTLNAYEKLLKKTVPREFQDISVLWSEAQMEALYQGPFEPQRMTTEGSVYHAHRSMWLPLQMFAKENPEYQYFYNWEMDAFSTGHWYDLIARTTAWASAQPMYGLDRRNSRFYIPSRHLNWAAYLTETLRTERSAISLTTKDEGVGKEADLIVFNPIFDPTGTGYVWRDDISGYQADLIVFNPIFDPTGTGYVWRDDISGYPLDEPKPALRCSIITTARLSSRLLHHMDQANTDGHIMASEMMAATVALQQHLKAVYVPIPVYFNRTPSALLAERIFNGGGSGYSGGHPKSVFSLGQEHFIQEGTYYYQADFARELWAAWTQGDICLPPMPLHPAKYS